MGLDIWFRDDVRRILAAIAAAGDERGPEYHKALHDVAIAFGVEPPGTARAGYEVQAERIDVPMVEQ